MKLVIDIPEKKERWLDEYFEKLYPNATPLTDCTDAISREIISNYVENHIQEINSGYGDLNSHTNRILRMIIDYINSLPSVNPTRPKAKWIDDNEYEIDAKYGRHLYRCSKCDRYANQFVGGTEDWWDICKPNYCPNCGAEMESD